MKNEKVVKFGGSSLSDSEKTAAAVRILEEDESRTVAVLSAPGKSKEERQKVTDALLSAWAGDTDAYDAVCARFRAIAAAFGIGDADTEEILCHLPPPDALFCRALGRDHYISRGEYCMARLFARIIGWQFVDAAELIVFDEDGRYDQKASEKKIRRTLKPGCRYVIPGFYGGTPSGVIRTFPRGGSDTTGAIIAAAMGMRYENLTDVGGVYCADPRILPDAARLPAISHREMRFLSHFGAGVLQEDTLLPAASEGIPIRLGLAETGGRDGSDILPLVPDRPLFYARSGRCGYTLLSVVKRSPEGGDIAKVLLTVNGCGIGTEAVTAFSDEVLLLLESRQLAGLRRRLLHRLFRGVHPDHAVFRDGVAVLAMIGEAPLTRFREEGIPILACFSQAGRRLVCVGEELLDAAIRIENR